MGAALKRTGAIDPIDVFTSMVDASLKRLRLTLAQGSRGVLLVACLWHTRRMLDRSRDAISGADVTGEADRYLLHRVAARHQSFADVLERIRCQLADERLPLRLAPFRFAAVRLLETLVIEAEDVAETAALGASAEFAKLVKEDLRNHRVAYVNG